MKHLLIADDHFLFRESLALIVSEFFPSVTIEQVGTWGEAHTMTKTESFDLALIDLEMPSQTEWLDDLTAIVKNNAQVPICVLSGFRHPEGIKRAFEVGVKGYMTKDSSSEEVRQAILTIIKGGSVIPGNVFTTYANSRTRQVVSNRQYEILVLIEKGYSNRQIAVDTGIKEGTVKHHVHNIFTALGATNRLEAVKLARQRGILMPLDLPGAAV